jgi:hypothetical protein
MNNLPKVGDTIFVETYLYKGEITITYIDEPNLYLDHFLPIQGEINEADLDQLDDFNHYQTMLRVSLSDLASATCIESTNIEEDVQGSLFD